MAYSHIDNELNCLIIHRSDPYVLNGASTHSPIRAASFCQPQERYEDIHGRIKKREEEDIHVIYIIYFNVTKFLIFCLSW